MRVLLLLSMLVPAGCSQLQPLDPNIEVPLDQSFILRVDQTATVSGTPLSVRFDQVPEDSRCPSDVVCVWAGNARVHLVLSVERDEEVGLDLNTGLEPRSASALGYRITLEKVQPIPTSGSSIPPADYLAHLRVTAN
jgi:hypothetical protein